MKPLIFSAIQKAFVATAILLFVYFTILSLVSGWGFAQNQFGRFWYYVVILAGGFGFQIGLYSYLKSIVKHRVSKGVVATTGTTSTVAMISCCAHYLVNVLPLGAVGIITIISSYQIQLFWVGMISNLVGIVYLFLQVRKFTRLH